MKLTTVIAACLLAASSTAFAQSGDAKPPAKKARFDCSQAKDPKACEERRARIKAAHDKASKACEAKKGAEHRDCMRTQMCASAKDPKACEARAKEMQAKRDQIRAACKDKQGEELKTCIREQRGKK